MTSGVGSDLDLLILLTASDQPIARRALEWNVTDLPVPAEVLVYTMDEWAALRGRRFHETVTREAAWVWPAA